jgi:hypothetical protein
VTSRLGRGKSLPFFTVWCQLGHTQPISFPSLVSFSTLSTFFFISSLIPSFHFFLCSIPSGFLYLSFLHFFNPSRCFPPPFLLSLLLIFHPQQLNLLVSPPSVFSLLLEQFCSPCPPSSVSPSSIPSCTHRIWYIFTPSHLFPILFLHSRSRSFSP